MSYTWIVVVILIGLLTEIFEIAYGHPNIHNLFSRARTRRIYNRHHRTSRDFFFPERIIWNQVYVSTPDKILYTLITLYKIGIFLVIVFSPLPVVRLLSSILLVLYILKRLINPSTENWFGRIYLATNAVSFITLLSYMLASVFYCSNFH